MNQEKNNEIDLMLRKLGRLSEASTERVPEDQHLDADELNMYAENVLVPTTRARYTEHLADCSQCRQIVSKLSLAAGGVIHEKKATVPASSSIKDLLSRLFSPMVLKYAAPALVLLIISSIGFWVFTDSWSKKSALENSKADSVAKNEPVPQASGVTYAVQDKTTEANSPAQPAKESADTRQPSEEQQPVATPAEAQKEAQERKREEPAKVADSIAATPANVAGASAPAAPRPVVATEKAGEDVVAKKNKTAEPPPPARDADAEKTAESKAEYQPKGVGNATGSPAKLRGAQVDRVQQGRESDEAGRRADKKDDAETKSVAGRQFRREGSKWIDTAYSSQATTNISRGSEQYRALIADEPSIRTIADQLGGEVIVVWKGRAYRIR